MIDRIFGTLLTFCVLAGGTVAVGSAMMEHDRHANAIRTTPASQIVQLPTVEITVKRSTVARSDASAEPTARQLQ